jgi:hypothetical protein
MQSESERQAAGMLWMHHMRRGEFEQAWLIGDAVQKSRAKLPCWHLPRHLQWVWDGSPFHGRRVLVRCYHGLGDTIQFIRYVPLVKALAAEVTVWAQPELIPLLKSLPGIDRLLPLHDGTPEYDFEVDVEIMELAHVFRTTLGTIPSPAPYLDIAPSEPDRNSDQLAIGLVWQSGDWNRHRSIPFPELRPLANVANVEWRIVQHRPEQAGWNGEFGVSAGDLELLEFACAIRALDLLITVDSMPAHLAGAMGIPVWILLSAEADWRWMTDRDDSPWYPTAKLFRQSEPGDWRGVVQRVLAELELRVNSPSSHPTTSKQCAPHSYPTRKRGRSSSERQ